MTSRISTLVLLTSLCTVLFASLASATVATVENYGYPLTDRFEATVVGTPAEFEAQLPKHIPFKEKYITIFPERKTPDVFFYGSELIYSVALQKQEAPLIFLIAGTGASHNGSKNYNMARAFYQAGFHVISISSPTFTNFVIAASNTGVVGHAEKDAEDLYRVMEMVWEELDNDVTATSFNITGYSLGAFNAAYVSKLDEERGTFNFKRVLLINPPVSLYNSISLLDRMIDNIPGGMDNFPTFFNYLAQQIGKIYRGIYDGVDEDFLYKAYLALDLKDEELAALVGTSFRISSSSLAFTSDVVADYGYIKPKGLVLDRYSNLAVFDKMSRQLGFTDYYHEFFYPFYREEDPGKTRDEFIAAVSLTKISDYLRSSKKISVMHNADDIILETGEIDFFPEIFGDRATIYPHGGHCGNMNYRDNVAHMIATFTDGGNQ